MKVLLRFLAVSLVILLLAWLGLYLGCRSIEPKLGTDLPRESAPPQATKTRLPERVEAGNRLRDSLRAAAQGDDWLGTLEKSLALLKEEIGWLQSSRSVADQSVALLSIKGDLELLVELLKWRPPDDPSPPLNILKEWNPESIDFHPLPVSELREEIIRLRRQILRQGEP